MRFEFDREYVGFRLWYAKDRGVECLLFKPRGLRWYHSFVPYTREVVVDEV